jgi:hypothetical protein
MNKEIKELAEEAGLIPMWVCVNESTGSQVIKPIDEQIIERFAELVRQDLYQEIGKGVITQINVAVLMEREACAKLCESMGVHPALNVYNGGPEWYQRQKECAAAIRGRRYERTNQRAC